VLSTTVAIGVVATAPSDDTPVVTTATGVLALTTVPPVPALAAVAPAVVPTPPVPAAETIAPGRAEQIIHIPEDYDAQFTAEPGDTIIEIMYPTGDIAGRCDDHGGELVWNPNTDIYTCEGVDF